MSKSDIPALLFYTDDILDDNFHKIVQFNNDVLDTLENILAVVDNHQSRLKSLENINLVVKTKSGKLLPFLAGAAVGVYIYRNRQKLKNVSTDKIVDGIEHALYGDDEKTKPGKPTNDQKN